MNALLLFLWISSVYKSGVATSHAEQKRDALFEKEPHPYTISFFTFPKGFQFSNSKKTTTKRDNDEFLAKDNATKPGTNNATSHKLENLTSKIQETKAGSNHSVVVTSSSNISSTSIKHQNHNADAEHTSGVHTKHKIPKPFVQMSEEPSGLDKAGKPPEVGPQHSHEKVDDSKIDSTHNKVQVKLHQKQQPTDESYQEGSIDHPAHKMYPKCHHCARNSSYEDCTQSSTLSKCDQGLNNICFTKSFRSTSRGIIYEMGCSNHLQCKRAKPKPCKGKVTKCFVCCQYDGCNAVPHHDFYTPDKDAEDIGFAYLNKASIYSSSKWVIWAIVLLQALVLFW